jgi:monoterpene epsilon-lactone hydrolase
MVSPESRAYLQELRKGVAFGDAGNAFNLEALRQCMGLRLEPADRNVKCIPVRIDGLIPCEWVLAPDADPDVRLLYLHGGGFVAGSGVQYLPLAALISAEAQCAVLLPDYRLAPEHPFPAGLEDCIRAHEWLLASGPFGSAPAKATFIAGDSAGGNLTLATLLALRDRGRPLPLAGIPLSASTDLTLAGESMRTEKDPICSARAMAVFAELYLGKATNPRDPLASPLFGDYTGIPPLLIQVGEHEMLRDDSVRLAAKARSDGVDATLEVWPGMVHVFHVRELPESREAVQRIAAFMRVWGPNCGEIMEDRNPSLELT